jgi:flagellar basal-body rod modification protein FlgD
MNISELATNYASSGQSGGTVKKEIGQEEFLTLLVEQIKNQDPLNPMESMEFTSQLTQFSSLEQLFSVNKALGGISESLAKNQDENALDYIGKTVLVSDNTLEIKGGKLDSGTYSINDDADVKIYIYDQWGNQVRRLDTGAQSAGEYKLDWDGRDSSGSPVADGQYNFSINAYDSNDNAVTSATYLAGVVSGVNYKDGNTYLNVGNQSITPDEVISIRMTPNDNN